MPEVCLLTAPLQPWCRAFGRVHIMRMALSHIDELSSLSSDRCVSSLPATLQYNYGIVQSWSERGDESLFCLCRHQIWSEGRVEREKDTFIWNWIWMRGRRRRAGRKLPRDDHMKGHAISRRFSPRSAIRLVGAKRFSCPLGTNCGCSSPDVSLEYAQVLNFDWGKSSFSTNKAKVEEEKLEEDTLTLELESMGAWNASEKFSIQFANDWREGAI